jgi:hypothetical protein
MLTLLLLEAMGPGPMPRSWFIHATTVWTDGSALPLRHQHNQLHVGSAGLVLTVKVVGSVFHSKLLGHVWVSVRLLSVHLALPPLLVLSPFYRHQEDLGRTSQ